MVYRTYYKRKSFVRGKPDMASYPEGEEDFDYIPKRPQYNYINHDFDNISHNSLQMESFVNLILNQVSRDLRRL